MATYRAYAYCKECDRPLRENEYRSESIDGGKYCRLCDSRARDFKKMIILPWHLYMALILCIGFTFAYFKGANPSIMIGLPFPTIEIIPVLVFVGLFVRTKSKCKPIYDRWVMQHGTDPDKWPAPAKPE